MVAPRVSTATPWIRYAPLLGTEAADHVWSSLLHQRPAEEADPMVGPSDEPWTPSSLPEALQDALQRVLPDAAAQLTGNTELAGTAIWEVRPYSDDNYTGLRNDAHSGRVPADSVMFTYMLAPPRPAFTGGVLRLYDSSIRLAQMVPGDTYREVFPDHDTLVLAPTDCWYDISHVSHLRGSDESAMIMVHGWVW